MYFHVGGNSEITPTRSLGNVIERLYAEEFGLGNDFIEFKHVMEPFPAPIMITTADTKIVYVNPAWERQTGYTFAEVQGRKPHFLSCCKTNRKLYSAMWRQLLKGKPFETEAIVDQRKDGSTFNINSVIFPVQRNGKTYFYVQVQQDITNRKKLEELKKEFLSMATHELKTPLTTLKLLVGIQIRKAANKEQGKINLHELEIINSELNRLTRIIDDLSDVSRVEAGKLRMELKEVNIAFIIRDVVKQMKTVSNGHSIVTGLILPVYVVADEGRIKQVLINLIKNAIKYSHPGTDIMISTDVRSKRCIVSVQNKGEPIPQDKLPYLFDRFYQLNTGDTSGLGLGLYISKKIIDQHKGKLWVESENSALITFSFSLQIAEKGGE